MKQQKLNLAVVGLGEGKSILSAATTSHFWQLQRICDLNEQLCQHRAQEFNVPHYSLNLEETLGDPLVDVVALYTPDPLHAPHIIACLKAGKHVICTKPMLDGLSQAREVYETWKNSGRQVFVGQSSRFFEPMIHQRRDFETGRNGEIWAVEAHYNHDHRHYMMKPWAKSGGLKWIYCGLSHPVDLVCWYMPNIVEVFGYGTVSPFARQLGFSKPDLLQFVLKDSEGKVARVSGCYGLPDSNLERESYITCILRGDKGYSQADYSELRYNTNFEGEGMRQQTFKDKHAHYFRFNGIEHHAGEFQNYIDYFAECLVEGRNADPGLEEGIRTVAVMQAMEESLETGKPVSPQQLLQRHNLPFAPSFTQ